MAGRTDALSAIEAMEDEWRHLEAQAGAAGARVGSVRSVDSLHDQRLRDIDACIDGMLQATQEARQKQEANPFAVATPLQPTPTTTTNTMSPTAAPEPVKHLYVNDLPGPGDGGAHAVRQLGGGDPLYSVADTTKGGEAVYGVPGALIPASEVGPAAAATTAAGPSAVTPSDELVYGEAAQPVYGVPGALVPEAEIGAGPEALPAAVALLPRAEEAFDDIYANELEGGSPASDTSSISYYLNSAEQVSPSPTASPLRLDSFALAAPSTPPARAPAVGLGSPSRPKSAKAARPVQRPATAPSRAPQPVTAAESNPFLQLLQEQQQHQQHQQPAAKAGGAPRARSASSAADLAPGRHRRPATAGARRPSAPSIPRLLETPEEEELPEYHVDANVAAFLQSVVAFCKSHSGVAAWNPHRRRLLHRLPEAAGVRTAHDFRQLHRHPQTVDWRALGAFGSDKLALIQWSQAFSDKSAGATSSPKGGRPQFSRARTVSMPASALPAPQSTQFKMLQDIGRELWYHGPMTRELAEGTLRGKRPGTFLIRVSHNQSTPTLSLATPSRMMHFKIVVGRGTVQLDGHSRTFVGISFLVEHYRLNAVTQEGDFCKYPAIRRR